jgi:hypothetical protein
MDVVVELIPATRVHTEQLRPLARRVRDGKICAEQIAVVVVPELAGMLDVGGIPMKVRIADGASLINARVADVARLFGIARGGEAPA